MDLKQIAEKFTTSVKSLSPKHLLYLLLLVVFILMLTAQLELRKVRGEEIEIQATEQDEANMNSESDVKKELADPVNKEVCVEVAGAVMVPGVYCLDSGEMVVNAVEKAGGINRTAYAGNYVGRNINLARTVVDHEKIYIPFSTEMICESKEFIYVDEEIEKIEGDFEKTLKGKSDNNNENTSEDKIPNNVKEQIEEPIEEPVEEPTEEPIEEVPTPEDEDNAPGEGDTDCINLNSATSEELTSISGIGDATAQKIIDARPFTAIEQLLDVNGIGESKYNLMKDLVCI